MSKFIRGSLLRHTRPSHYVGLKRFTSHPHGLVGLEFDVNYLEETSQAMKAYKMKSTGVPKLDAAVAEYRRLNG